MKFEEYAHVRIIRNNVMGVIIHMYQTKEGTYRYTIESDEEGPIDDPGAWNDVRFPQFICDEDEIELV